MLKSREPTIVSRGISFRLQQLLDEYGMSVSELARRLDVTRTWASRLVNGRVAELSPMMALRLECVFPELDAQEILLSDAAYRLDQARKIWEENGGCDSLYSFENQ